MGKPIPKDINDYLGISSDSPSGLIWIKSRRGIRVGGVAGSPVNGNPNRYSVCYKGKRYLTHRVLHFLRTGVDPKNLEIDHKNHGNIKDVLRLATRSLNNANRRNIKIAASGYKGVHWEKRRNKWMAQIKAKSKCFYLGLYNTRIEAAWAYNQAALKHFGEFAVLNVLLIKAQ
jgi:hypothetical protein